MLEGNFFKIKEGKLEAWKKWCEELSGPLREEATLKEEKVSREAFIHFKIDDHDYVIGLGDGEALPATLKEINLRHKAISRECLEYVGKVSNLYDLSA